MNKNYEIIKKTQTHFKNINNFKKANTTLIKHEIKGVNNI